MFFLEGVLETTFELTFLAGVAYISSESWDFSPFLGVLFNEPDELWDLDLGSGKYSAFFGLTGGLFVAAT
jgi:hypothetical protein